MAKMVIRSLQNQMDELKVKWPRLKSGLYLYILRDPITSEPKLVGQTVYPYERMRQHLLTFGGAVVGGATKRGWMASLYFKGLAPKMEIVAIVESSMADSQQQSLIKSYLDSGIALFNRSLFNRKKAMARL